MIFIIFQNGTWAQIGVLKNCNIVWKTDTGLVGSFMPLYSFLRNGLIFGKYYNFVKFEKKNVATKVRGKIYWLKVIIRSPRTNDAEECINKLLFHKVRCYPPPIRC